MFSLFLINVLFLGQQFNWKGKLFKSAANPSDCATCFSRCVHVKLFDPIIHEHGGTAQDQKSKRS